MTTNKTPETVIIEDRQNQYQGFIGVESLQLKHQLHNGNMSNTLQRECIHRMPAVTVMAFDPAQQQVVLIQQFRVGAIDDTRSPWLWECVAGIIEPGEDILSVAKRELKEETGLDADHIELLFDCYTSPGASNENTTLCYAKVDATKASGVHGLADEGEDILVKAFPLAEAINMMEDQRIYNAMTILSLQWLMIHAPHLT